MTDAPKKWEFDHPWQAVFLDGLSGKWLRLSHHGRAVASYEVAAWGSEQACIEAAWRYAYEPRADLGGGDMTDYTLHGNCEPCPACELRREAVDTAAIFRPEIQCQVCNGTGLLPLSDAEIVRRTCEEASRIYWPQFEARIAAQIGERR